MALIMAIISALPAAAGRPGGGAMPAALVLVDATGLTGTAAVAGALETLREEVLGMFTDMCKKHK
jgi:hypothetical protein